MLRCPKCNRTYQDDMQKFCTHDGGRLVPDMEKPQAFDPNATVHGAAANLGIPITPPVPPPLAPPAPAPAPDLNKTIAAAPPPSGTTGVRPPSDTSPVGFQKTTKLPQPPEQQTDSRPTPESQPPPPVHQPPSPPVHEPPPPVHQLPPSGQFPTMIAPHTSAPDLPPVSVRLPSNSMPLSSGTGPFPAPSAPLPTGPVQSPQTSPLDGKKKSGKLGLILAGVGALLLLLIIGGGAAAYYFLKASKSQDSGGTVTVNPALNANSNNGNTNVGTDPNLTIKPRAGEAPVDSVKFENSSANLDGKLLEHYLDFYFYYPQSWQKSPKAGVPGAANFVEVERRLPPDYTQENLTVSWYESKGTLEKDLSGKLPDLVKNFDANFSKSLPEYEKVSEGKTTINGIDGYEFRFKAMQRNTDKGDIAIWGRVVFLPPGDEESTKGVTLLMLTSSLAPELQSVDDVGLKGELPVILNSFTLGKS